MLLSLITKLNENISNKDNNICFLIGLFLLFFGSFTLIFTFSFFLYKKKGIKHYSISLIMLISCFLLLCYFLFIYNNFHGGFIFFIGVIFITLTTLAYILISINIFSKSGIFNTWMFIIGLFILTCITRIILVTKVVHDSQVTINVFETIQMVFGTIGFGDLGIKDITQATSNCCLITAILMYSLAILLALCIITVAANNFWYEKYSIIRLIINEIKLSFKRHLGLNIKSLYNYVIFLSLTEIDIEYCIKLKKADKKTIIIFYGEEIPKFDINNKLCRIVKDNKWLYISKTNSDTCLFDELSIKHKNISLSDKILFTVLSVLAAILTFVLFTIIIFKNFEYTTNFKIFISILYFMIVLLLVFIAIIIKFAFNHINKNNDTEKVCIISALRNENSIPKSYKNINLLFKEIDSFKKCITNNKQIFVPYYYALTGLIDADKIIFDKLKENNESFKFHIDSINSCQLSCFDLVNKINNIDKLNEYKYEFIGFGEISRTCLNTIYSLFNLTNKTEINCYDNINEDNKLINNNGLYRYIEDNSYFNINSNSKTNKTQYEIDYINAFNDQASYDEIKDEVEANLIKINIKELKDNIINDGRKKENKKFFIISLGDDLKNIDYLTEILKEINNPYNNDNKNNIIAINIKDEDNNYRIKSLVNQIFNKNNINIDNNTIDYEKLNLKIIIFGNHKKIHTITNIINYESIYSSLWKRYDKIKCTGYKNEESFINDLFDFDDNMKNYQANSFGERLTIRFLPYLNLEENDTELEQNIWCRIKISIMHDRLIKKNDNEYHHIYFSKNHVHKNDNNKGNNVGLVNCILNTKMKKFLDDINKKLAEIGSNIRINNVYNLYEFMLFNSKNNNNLIKIIYIDNEKRTNLINEIIKTIIENKI